MGLYLYCLPNKVRIPSQISRHDKRLKPKKRFNNSKQNSTFKIAYK